MPSQAYSFFRESEWNYLRGYRDVIFNRENECLDSRNKMLAGWLDGDGYKTSILNYTQPVTGKQIPTLYAIYHAPKGDDTEAIVLVAPWHTKQGEINLGGVSLGVSLARYFHRLSIWAKNIIVVFPEDGQDTLRNWVNTYHTTLDQTGGSILGAMVLEYPSGKDGIDYVKLEYTGINGQLPNLDLVNTAVMIGDHEGFKVSIHNTPKGQLWTDDYPNRLTTMLKAIFSYATSGILPPQGHAGGNGCEAFSGWNIQAITLTAVGNGDRDITTFGRVVEATFRSVNNLLEKFHQSYFFYLLLAPMLFVSIGDYLPAAALSAAAVVFAAISAFLGNANINNIPLKFSPALASAASAKSIIFALAAYFTLIASCLTGGLSLAKISSEVDYTNSTSPFYWAITYKFLVVPSVLLCLLPQIIAVIPWHSHSSSLNDFTRLFYSFSLYCFAFTLVAMLLLHFSLSMLVAFAAFPLAFIRYGPSYNHLNRLRSTCLLVLSNPFVYLFVYGIVRQTNFDLDMVRNSLQYFQFSHLQHDIQDVIDWVHSTTLDEVLNGPVELLYGLLSGYWRFANWTWVFLIISWIPVWLAAVITSSIGIEKADYEVDDNKKSE